MDVCMDICIWTCVCGHVCMDMCVWTCSYGHVYMDMCIWACVYGHVYMDMCIWACMYGHVYMDMRMWACTCHVVSVEVRGQLRVGTGFLFPLCISFLHIHHLPGLFPAPTFLFLFFVVSYYSCFSTKI